MPLIDTDNGGSLLRDVRRRCERRTTASRTSTAIINGHTTAQTAWADLKEFADFNEELVDVGTRRAQGGQDARGARCRVEAAGEVQGLFAHGQLEDGRVCRADSGACRKKFSRAVDHHADPLIVRLAPRRSEPPSAEPFYCRIRYR